MPGFHDLIARFHFFREDVLLKERDFFAELARGQAPKTLVVACCDSRADPAILMGVKPGDLFVVRSIAAIVPASGESAGPDAVMAAVEYGVKHLGVANIIVMGHSNCGGVHAALHPEAVESEPYIFNWVRLAQGVVDEEKNEHPVWKTPHELQRRCEEGVVLNSINNLLSYEWVAEKVAAGTLALHALYYDMHEAMLHVWNHEREDFEATTLEALSCPLPAAGGKPAD